MTSRRLGWWCWYVVASLVLAGCGTPTIRRADLEAVRSGQRSLVLLRVQGLVDQEQMTPTIDLTKGFWASTLSLSAPLDAKARATVAHADRVSGKRGWVAFALPPGTHVLSLDAGVGQMPRPMFLQASIGALLLDVPPGGSVVYAGTLQLTGQRRKRLFATRYEWLSLTLGKDDRDEAARVARTMNLSSMPQWRPARLYGRALEASTPQPGSVVMDVCGNAALASPDWTSRGMSLFTGAGQSGSGSVDALGAMSSAGEAGAAVAIGYLLYLPMGATVGALAGSAHGSRLKPAIDALGQQVQQFDVVTSMRNAVARDLGTSLAAGSDATGHTGLALRVEVLRVQLREVVGDHNPFCLEVATRVTLTDTARSCTPFDAYLTYSHAKAVAHGKIPLPLPTEMRLEVESPPHPIDEWCGPQGGQIMAEQLQAAISLLASEAVTRTRTSPLPAPRSSLDDRGIH